MSDITQEVAAYLAHRMPDARGMAVDQLARIHGGSSQETFRLRARWEEAGNLIERRLILRREPPSGLVVAQRDLEFTVYQALAGSSIPVPKAYFVELETKWLERPFFVMDLMPGKAGAPFSPEDPYDGHGETIARQFWRYLGTLAALDHREVGLEGVRGGTAVGSYWEHELKHWEDVLDSDEVAVEPIPRAAIRWLRREPPPQAVKPAIVHGDYRSGNFLFTDDGRISAILDWEMCHIGDPLEDVAWALDEFWSMTRHLPLEEGLAEWETASGMSIDRAALDWWRLFVMVKGCALWTAAAASFSGRRSPEMTVALAAIRSNMFHRDAIVRFMQDRGLIP